MEEEFRFFFGGGMTMITMMQVMTTMMVMAIREIGMRMWEVQEGGNVSYWLPRAGEVGGVQGGEQPRYVFFCFVFAYFSFFVFTHTKILSVLSRNASSSEKLTSDFCKKNAANWKNVFST